MVFLKIAPMKGVLRFEMKGKLNPRFVGPFEILERIGSVAYRLALPPSFSAVHDVFHVSMLRSRRRRVPNPLKPSFVSSAAFAVGVQPERSEASRVKSGVAKPPRQASRTPRPPAVALTDQKPNRVESGVAKLPRQARRTPRRTA
ncbi:ty3-gypsy retrotransposon protein [Cucumis melo var. makuwa]|uniref:Ty3-gypsy retrotransposon protein n=1 Tax=Cucumis melo var. makuwa TaxID=1194695 RepID=A0A5D3DV24_CUCMM|nr:ty3-gypsy retrotransposon protein [Cucumis melo var. makuwa]TYK27150.1 ty3-gypsy retrotransposon protein [Cucumis melo var. makuwa]